MAVSSINTLKTNLLAQLALRSGLNGVLVSWGWPKAPQREMLILGDISDWTQEAAAQRYPQPPREESYRMEVLVYAEKKGWTQADANARAFVIAAEIENQLRTDPTVNGAVRVAQFAGGKLEEQTPEGGESRIALLTIYVDCDVRI